MVRGDGMFTNSDLEHINKEYQIRIQQRRKKMMSVWSACFAVVVSLIIFFIVIFPNQFSNENTVWILPSYGGLLFVVTLLGTLISMYYVSEKPYYDYVLRSVVEKINLDEGLYHEYSAYDKDQKPVFVEGGLFTRHASEVVKRHISGVTEEEHPFDIYDCTLTTSSGKSSTTHFKGIYFVLKKQFPTTIQVRTKGTPKWKGVDVDKVNDNRTYKVFKLKDQAMNQVDYDLVKLFQSTCKNLMIKDAFMSVLPDQLHFAVWYQKLPYKKEKVLTYQLLQSLYNEISKEYLVINQLDSSHN